MLWRAFAALRMRTKAVIVRKDVIVYEETMPFRPCSAHGVPFHSEHWHARKRASRRPAAAADAAEAAARAMPTLPTYTQPAAPSAAALEHMQRPETTKTRLKQ